MGVIMLADPTQQMRRLVEFASDVTRLADERQDFELRAIIDNLPPISWRWGVTTMDDRDDDRLRLHDRIAERIPQLDDRKASVAQGVRCHPRSAPFG
jgi:hypothetical protein